MAAGNSLTTVRIAAAYGAQRMDAKNGQVLLDKLLDDTDPGVVKYTIKSAVALNVAKNLKTKISKISKDFADEGVKAIAVDLVKRLR
jgi:hypothetical protein